MCFAERSFSCENGLIKFQFSTMIWNAGIYEYLVCKNTYINLPDTYPFINKLLFCETGLHPLYFLNWTWVCSYFSINFIWFSRFQSMINVSHVSTITKHRIYIGERKPISIFRLYIDHNLRLVYHAYCDFYLGNHFYIFFLSQNQQT